MVTAYRYSAAAVAVTELVVVLRRNLRASLLAGRLGEAESDLSALEGEDPLSAYTEGLRLEWLIRSGRASEAVALSALLVERHPASPRIWYLGGWASFRGKAWAEAERRFRESQALHPATWTQVWLGRTLARSGKLDEAESVLRPLRAYDPVCTTELAWVMARRGRPDVALELLDAHLLLHPGDTFAIAQRATLRVQTLAPEEALAQADVLLGLGEEVPEALISRALPALLTGFQDADCRRYIAMVEPARRLSLGWTCYLAGADALAFDIFLEALGPTPRDPKLLAALEAAAKRIGATKTLIGRYRALTPANPHLWGRMKRLAGG